MTLCSQIEAARALGCSTHGVLIEAIKGELDPIVQDGRVYVSFESVTRLAQERRARQMRREASRAF